jgi:fatty acid desaturase
MLLRTVVLVALVFLFHYWSVVATNNLLAFILAVLHGFAAALICFMPVHEASHAATTDSPKVWRLLGAIHDFVNGASWYNWCHQHFLGHHPFTNVTDQSMLEGDSMDPDTVTNEPDIRRIKPHQQYHNHYKFQVIYAPLLYSLLGIKTRISDFTILFVSKMNGKIRVNPLSTWHQAVFWGGKAFWIYYRFILPAQYIGIARTMALNLVADMVLSWTLAFVFQVNHVVPQAKWPKLDKSTNTVTMDWAEMQIRTTMDYGHDSPLTTFFTGALNYQVVHHLFPYISQLHYAEIAPIIKEHCKKYNIEYNYVNNFADAFKAHIMYLAKMGHAHYDL